MSIISLIATEVIRFDVFVSKDLAQEYSWLKSELYQASNECEFVKKFLESDPEMEYLGSEDMAHSFTENVRILQLLIDLHRKGFEFTSVDLRLLS